MPGSGRAWRRSGIDWQFLPNAALGEAMGRANGCYGATMALRAETLARLGGFAALSGLLADDHALGVAVRRLGLRVVVAPVLPAHVMAEPGLLALLRHELRWARTLRLLDLRGYAGMGVTFPLAWGCWPRRCSPGAGWRWPWRWRRGWASPSGGPGAGASVGASIPAARALPLRDAFSFAIWGAGLARGTVTWQGRRYRMRPRRQHGRRGQMKGDSQ